MKCLAALSLAAYLASPAAAEDVPLASYLARYAGVLDVIANGGANWSPEFLSDAYATEVETTMRESYLTNLDSPRFEHMAAAKSDTGLFLVCGTINEGWPYMGLLKGVGVSQTVFQLIAFGDDYRKQLNIMLLCSRSGAPIPIRAGGREDARERDSSADATGALECLRQAVRIESTELEARFIAEHGLKVTLSNRLPWPISRAKLHLVLRTEGRVVPWTENDEVASIMGGIEPGETRDTSVPIFIPAMRWLLCGSTSRSSTWPTRTSLSRRCREFLRSRSQRSCDPASFVSVATPDAPPPAPVGPSLTDDEKSALSETIQLCWNTPAGCGTFRTSVS